MIMVRKVLGLDNKWTESVTEWTPREWTRRQGRPITRWGDNLIGHLGPVWPIIETGVYGNSSGVGFLLTE